MNLQHLARTGIKFIADPNYRFAVLSTFGMYNDMPDEEYLCRLFKANLGYKLNLDNPITYNEKIQWLKLYDRNPLYTKLVDKYEVKEYVGNRIGQEHIIKTLGIYDKFDQIDFDILPKQFVIKCTHDSGGIVIVKDKGCLNINKAKKKINDSLGKNFYYRGREWPYKNLKPRIIVEEYIEDNRYHELIDYKFFAFDGKVQALFIATDRQSSQETKFDFFDCNFRHLDITNGHPNSSVPIDKPEHFDEMIEIAKELSKGIPHVRVDLYEANGVVLFGELTFSHWSGLVPFEPSKWDKVFGDWIELPQITRE